LSAKLPQFQKADLGAFAILRVLDQQFVGDKLPQARQPASCKVRHSDRIAWGTEIPRPLEQCFA
jgi:hypothetical protein